MHLPGVGENFEDHLEVYIQHNVNNRFHYNLALMSNVCRSSVYNGKVQRR